MTHTLLRRGQQNEWWGQQIKILKTTFDCTRTSNNIALSLYFQEVRSAWNPRNLSTGIQTLRIQQIQRKRIFLIFWQIEDFSRTAYHSREIAVHSLKVAHYYCCSEFRSWRKMFCVRDLQNNDWQRDYGRIQVKFLHQYVWWCVVSFV